jgi:hypothetical protein
MAKPIPIRTKNLSLDAKQYPSPISPGCINSHFDPTGFLRSYTLPTRFTDSYSLVEELGCGGYGFVFSIRRINDGSLVACKFIFKNRIDRKSWTLDESLGKCPLEVYILKNVKDVLTIDQA